MRGLFLQALLSASTSAILTGGLFNTCCTTTEPPTTTVTEDPMKPTTTNGYQALGWMTDDDGNIFVGNDVAKLYLFQMPAEQYWAPIPKDWPEGPLFGSLWPDSPNYRPLPIGYARGGRK